MDSEVRVRTFLALPLAPLFHSDISTLLKEMKRIHPSVRWIDPDKVHITLHFFGSISELSVQEILTIVPPIASQTKPFKLFLEDMGAFPNLQRPRVIWIGVKGETEALGNLQESLEEKLKEHGFPCEERDFKPHLTIGRIKEGGRLLEALSTAFGPTDSKILREIVLFKSDLTREGPRHEAIETFHFSAS